MPTYEQAVLNPDLIVREDRARSDFGDIEELKASINQKGVIQPISVAKLPDGTFKLLAGERRLRCVRLLGHKEIPVLIRETEDELDEKEVELFENLHRKDFEYKELVRIKYEIHQLMIAKHGSRFGASKTGGWTAADSAKLLHESPQNFGRDLKLAQAIESMPELAQMKSKSDAQKAMSRLEEEIVRRELARRGLDKIAALDRDSKIRMMADAYVIGDFFDRVKDVETGSIDLIELDPPYAIDLHSMRYGNEDSKTVDDNYNEVERKDYPPFMQEVYRECYRVLRDDGWLIHWFGPDPWFMDILTWLHKANLLSRGIPGIWTKRQGQTHLPDIYLANSYEMFFYARKGNAKLHKKGRANEFEFSRVNKPVHPTERPIELMVELLSTFISHGNVMVPFLGSGNTLIAAFSLGFNAIGFELSAKYKDSYIMKLEALL